MFSSMLNSSKINPMALAHSDQMSPSEPIYRVIDKMYICLLFYDNTFLKMTIYVLKYVLNKK